MSPTSPRRPCPGYGTRYGRCPALISKCKRYCPDCALKARQQSRQQDDVRDRKDARRWCHARWYRKAVKMLLNDNPLCAECKHTGRIRPAAEVDHKIPHQGDWVLFIDRKNWQALCRSCHSKKTAKKDGGFGNRRRCVLT